jgi:prepilin-type N-terminal cleavage/methylation domain-containing protein
MPQLPASGPTRRQLLPKSCRGIGLTELMVVVTIISLLMMVAVPSYQRIRNKARASALVNDFRVFGAVFQAHAHERGSWPAEAAAGVVPAEITSEELKQGSWTRNSPIGGQFDWEFNQIHNGVRYRAAIVLADTAAAPLMIDLDLFRMMDADLDDGVLATGNFRLGENLCPLLILEP